MCGSGAEGFEVGGEDAATAEAAGVGEGVGAGGGFRGAAANGAAGPPFQVKAAVVAGLLGIDGDGGKPAFRAVFRFDEDVRAFGHGLDLGGRWGL